VKTDATLELPFQSAGEITTRRLPLSLIDIPAEYESKDSLIEDDALRRSIEKSGVQQSIVVVPDEKRFTLVKGARRVRISQIIGLKDIPALINEPPAGADRKAYRDRLRMILTQARQDLLPSQRAALIKQMMDRFSMNQRQVAEMLGVDPGSITNWLSVDRYIADVVRAIDTKRLTLHGARAFDGMTPPGQKEVWQKLGAKIASMAGNQAHKLVRTQYRPEKFPGYYVAPARTVEKLSRPTGAKRAIKRRPRLTKSEKEVLSQNLALREVELEELKQELAELKKAIALATQPVRAILRDEDLVSMIPKEMKEELDRFAEVYC
jgi:ParB/RepB/Spo0J family partition protein